MSDSWDEMRRAKEEQFFDEQNKEALARLKKQPAEIKKSPITGKAMKQSTMHGVTVDICEDSGGIWFDKGEIEIFLKNALEEVKGKSFLERFIKSVS